MTTIRFSVLIPVYNREKFVRECIDSIFAQTGRNYEIIVIDDGSTDRTPEVLQSYGAGITALRQMNQGPEIARNLGASRASGEYLVFLDSDDFLFPWALETYDQIIRDLGKPALIIGTRKSFLDGQEAGADRGPDRTIEVLMYRDYLSKDVSVGLSCSNIIVKRSVFQQAGGHRLSSPATFHADEHDIVLRLGTYGPCAVLEKPVTVAYRVHGGNTVRDVERMIDGIISLARAERCGQYPGGRRRRFARYSFIGGMAMCWVKYALKARHPILGLKLMVKTGPMAMAGGLMKLGRLVRRRTPSTILRPGNPEIPAAKT